MPTIYDNIRQPLLPALQQALGISYRADFCVGYFNLRGWRHLDDKVEALTGGEGYNCRLLVGMQRADEDDLRDLYRFGKEEALMDMKTAIEIRRRLAQNFRSQLLIGAPNNEDEAGLRRLAGQLRSGKLVIKLFLKHPLHAKLYLLHRLDPISPTFAYLGSSNLTFSGLAGQGELNIDVIEQDPARKLVEWFEARWADKWCVDISEEVVEIIEESWAREKTRPPYHIYLKMAYHLSREARVGLAEFSIPREFREILFDYQTAAVKIAARHLNQRGGVLIGDVVGLGKTLMATAVARIFEDDYSWDTLVICPKNLVEMWEDMCDRYRLRSKVMSVTRVIQELPDLRRYRLVLIDESQNLRNREGKRYRAIQEYIQKNDSRCILLSATPYNKSYWDLSSQLRLFLPDAVDLGIRPERLLREMGEIEFSQRYEAPLRSLSAFEQSPYPEDWRELMRLFMVRRTRSFIRENYASTDGLTGRKYLRMADGRLAYFPDRTPRSVTFPIDEADPADQYAQLYADDTVQLIGNLALPRYGLGNYRTPRPAIPPSADELRILDDLSRGGRRLMGFSRTNLFKRLESSGYAFELSVERHILRNYVFIHALENGLPLPIGTQDLAVLDAQTLDRDIEDTAVLAQASIDEPTDSLDEGLPVSDPSIRLVDEAQLRAQAARIYQTYRTQFPRRFRWIRPDLFRPELASDLKKDAEALLNLLKLVGRWEPGRDAKLAVLEQLLKVDYATEKVLIFSQFADTVDYLARQLADLGIDRLMGVTGATDLPTVYAARFSPVSNQKREIVSEADELRVLIATDVLSEGQNLQDAHIVVNFDLPWAIIRLIQRVGRVDRIGQNSPEIISANFWPAEGVERVIRLRSRLAQRLQQNAEVVGTDERFFEDELAPQPLQDLYNERAGLLDDDDAEVDLVSYAYQIWKNATDANPSLQTVVEQLPDVVYSAKAHSAGELNRPPGVLVFVATPEGNSALAWMDERGNSVTASQFTVLRAAECSLDTPATERATNHHELVEQGVAWIASETRLTGGQLGRPSGARYRTYERLQGYLRSLQGTLFESSPLATSLTNALEQLYQFPLRDSARDKLNRQLRSNITDEQLTELVIGLYQDDSLCIVQEQVTGQEPRIICSLGLVAPPA